MTLAKKLILGCMVSVAMNMSVMSSDRYGFVIDSIKGPSPGAEPGAHGQKVIVQYTAQKAQLIVNQGIGLLIGWVDIKDEEIPREGRLLDIERTTTVCLHSLIGASGLKPTQSSALLFTAPSEKGKHTLTVAIYEESNKNRYEKTSALSRIDFIVGTESPNEVGTRTEEKGTQSPQLIGRWVSSDNASDWIEFQDHDNYLCSDPGSSLFYVYKYKLSSNSGSAGAGTPNNFPWKVDVYALEGSDGFGKQLGTALVRVEGNESGQTILHYSVDGSVAVYRKK